jgi:hypothetical protein
MTMLHRVVIERLHAGVNSASVLVLDGVAAGPLFLSPRMRYGSCALWNEEMETGFCASWYLPP